MKWVGSTNIDLAEESLDLLEVADYNMESIDKEYLIADNLPAKLIFDECKRLNKSLLIDGITISLNESFITNHLSLVFLHLPGSPYHGLNVYPYSSVNHPAEISIGYPAFLSRYNHQWYESLLKAISSLPLVQVAIGSNLIKDQYEASFEKIMNLLTGEYLIESREYQ
jgi:hypothetical protein